MELHALILSLLILTIVSDTQAKSLETPVQCATSCTTPENVIFRPGNSYLFSYSATVESSFQTDAEPDSKTTLQIGTTARVDALSPCEMVLRLEDTTLNADREPSVQSQQAWIDSLEQNPLHFSWNDGQIPNLCAANDDPAWVLNIKRGILSVLQVSSVETAESVREIDVTGTCDSSYSVREQGMTTTINKTKLYNTCEERDEHLLFSYFTSYKIESPRQNFIYSSQNCQQQIVNGRIEEVSCAEKHTFRPFSNEQSGAQTKITQVLSILDTTRINNNQRKLTAATSRRTDLKFEKEGDAMSDSRDISEIQTFIDVLCDRMNGEDYVQVGKDFVKFIALLRRLDSPAIGQVESALQGACPSRTNALRQMFYDALQWCGSEGCVVFTARLIAEAPEDLSDDLATRWLNGMSLIKKPTLRMLESIMGVVKRGRMPETSYLIAGTIIHRLCDVSTGNCLAQPHVRNALAFFEEKLGTNCHTASENRKQEILLALRALGNAGQTNAVNILASCAEESGNDMETRIAAIASFRRMPCSSDRSALSRMLGDISQDSEVRIGSYLGLMECPNPTVIQQVIILLDDEEVQQVASFVWSHLDQLMRSKDPLKGYLKPLLMEAKFAKKHDLDPRKYSRYYEASIFSEKLNAGAVVESSVIWSPKSFVPRSAELGLSVDVFGQAVNLFEVGGRVEGVEAMIHSAMASDGFLKNNPLQFLVPNVNDNDNNDEDDAEEDNEEVEVQEMDQRSTRSADTQLVGRHRRQFQRDLHTEDSPNANWYFRVFGNEMVYGNWRSLRNRQEAMAMSSIINQLIQNGEYEYHDNAMIMNSEHILPTGVGLPLNVAFNGSASVDVNVNGRMNIRGLFSSPPSMVLSGLFEPRATIVISGTMAVDAHVTKIGIATESSALTSIKINGSASLNNGENLNVEINAPYARNTFFTFNHKLMKMLGEDMEDIGINQRNIDTQCSRTVASQRFCIEKPRTFEIFPISGPISMSAYIAKTDLDILSYQLQGRLVTRNFPAAFRLELNANTPSSDANRMRALLAYDVNDKSFKMTYTGQSNDIALNGKIETEPTRKIVTVTYDKNGVQQQFESTFEHRRNGEHRSWIASTHLRRGNETRFTSRLQAAIEPYRSISANFSIENLFTSPVIGNLTLQDKSEQNSLNYHGRAYLRIPNHVNNGGHFNLKFLPKSNNIKFGLDYQLNNMRSQRIIFNQKRQDHSTSDQTVWTAHQKFTMTQYPSLNHHVDMSFANGRESLNSMVKISYGRHAGEEDNNRYVLFNQSFSYANSGSRKSFDGKFHLAMPEMRVGLLADLKHLRSDSLFNTTVSVQDYAVQLVLQDDTSTNGRMNKRVHVEIPTPWGRVLIDDRIAETERNVYELSGLFRLGSSKGLALRGNCTVENRSNRKRFFVDVSGDNQNLLRAESLLEFRETGYFTFDNSISSKYSNPVSLNLRRAPYELEVEFEHNPSKYFNLFVAKTENYANATLKFGGSPGNRGEFSLEGRKIINEDQSNFTLSFSTNTRVFDFHKLAISANYETTASNGFNTGVWYKKDDLSLIEIGMTLINNELEKEVSLGLQQKATDVLPTDIAISGSLSRDWRNVNVVVLLNEIEKLNGQLTFDRDEDRINGIVSHQFNTRTVPSRVEISMIRRTRSIGLDLNYGSKQISVKLPNKIKPRMVFILTHNDNNSGVPQYIKLKSNYGTRPKDGGKGIWLVLTDNNEQPFIKSELMFHEANEKAIVFEIKNELSDTEIPTVYAKAYYRQDASNTSVGSFVKINDEILTKLHLGWTSNVGKFLFAHQLSFLPSYVPHHLKAEASLEGSFPQLNSKLVFELDKQKTQTTLKTGQNNQIMNLHFNDDLFSSFTDLNLIIAQVQNRFSVSITKGNALFEANITSSTASEHRLLSFALNQNLFVGSGFLHLPKQVKVDFSYHPNSISLELKYNRYSGLIVIDYDFNSGRNGEMVSFRWQSGEEFPINSIVPQEIQVALSMSEENIASVNLTWNEQVVRTSVVVDASEKTINLRLYHTVNVLTHIGIPRTLDLAGSATYLENELATTIDLEGNVEINDKNYNVYFHNFLDLVSSPNRINTTLRHNIMEVNELLNFPLEISVNATTDTTIYSTIETTLNIDFGRVYPDQNNPENLLRLTNNSRIIASFDPMRTQAELTFSHDFTVADDFPRFLKLNVYGTFTSSERSAVIYRDLGLSLQRDNIIEVADFTFSLNRARSLQKSMSLSMSHNATELYNYGVPKKFIIELQGKNILDSKLDITYDTSKKTIDFKIDYEGGKPNKLNVMFFHNFIMLAEVGVPEKVGFVIAITNELTRKKLEITGYYNEIIKYGYFILDWTNSEAFTFSYRHEQNATDDTVFPQAASIRISNSLYDSLLDSSLKLSIGKKIVHVDAQIETDLNTLPTLPISSRIEINQNLFKKLAREYEAHVSLSEEKVLEFVLEVNKVVKAELTSNFSLEEHGGSIKVDLVHSQKHWKKIIPKKVNIAFNYGKEFSNRNSQMFLNFNIRWGNLVKTIEFLTTRFIAADWKTLYVSTSFGHNFDNFVSLNSSAAVMYEITDTSGVLEANATYNNQAFSHVISATFNRQDSEIEAEFEIKLDNQYLEAHKVPHYMLWSVLANWEQPISTNMKLFWGDDMANFHLLFDKTSKAEFNVSHTFSWPIQEFDFVIKLPVEENVQVVAVLNGEVKNINLSGTFHEGQGLIQFEHNFDAFSANTATFECNYRFGPDYYVAVNATIDDQIYHVEGGFRNLNNGFQVTTTLLDNISRSATIQHQFNPGRISLELDHNIPEIAEYIRESTAISASLQKSPKFNLTAVLRQQDQSREFSVEMDTTRLRFAFAHGFDHLPIPHSLVLQLSSSIEPVTYHVSLEIDGVERIARASIDKTNHRAHFSHTISELDQWFVARDVIVGVKVVPETIGGELYISIDGDERRLGGSGNGGIFNFYQNLSVENFPRNVTLKVMGNLWPLNGAISLTIDEIERSISTQIEPRSLLFATTIQIRELEPYVPRHLSLQMNFNSLSGKVAISFFKNNRNQTLSANYDFNDTFRVEIVQNIHCLRELPSHLIIGMGLYHEKKTAVISLSVNESLRFILNGTVFNNDNGWYGLTIKGNHNYKKLIKKLGIIREPEITLRGKRSGSIYSGEAVIKLIKNHRFYSNFEITPKWLRKQKGLLVSYNHVYEKLTRNIEGHLMLNKERNGYSLSLQTKQNKPSRKTGNFNLVISFENDDVISFTLSTTAAHNFVKLLEMEVPSNVIGELSLTYNAEEMLTQLESSLTYDDVKVDASADLHTFNTNEKIGLKANATVSGSIYNKKYSLDVAYMQQERTFNYQLKVLDGDSDNVQRFDNLTFNYLSTPRVLMATLQLQQNELNRAGFPERMSISLEKINENVNKHWRFNFTIAETSTFLAIDFVMTDSPMTLDMGASFNTADSFLTGLRIPTHVLARFTVKANATNSEESFRFEYNDKMLMFNGSQIHTGHEGKVTYKFTTSFPKIIEWYGGSEIVDTYSYTKNNKKMIAVGVQTLDGNPVSNYNFTFDMKTYEFKYNSRYYNDGYDIVYRNTFSENEKKLLLTFSDYRNTHVIIDWKLESMSADFKVAYNCSEDQTLFGMPHHFLMNYAVDLTGDFNYNFEQLYKLKYNNKMLTSKVSIHGSKITGEASYETETNIPELLRFVRYSHYGEKYIYTFNAPLFRLDNIVTQNHKEIGNYSFGLDGKDLTFDLWYNDNGYKATYKTIYTDEEKSLVLTVTHNKKTVFNVYMLLETADRFTFTLNFSHRLRSLRKLRIPKTIQANGDFPTVPGRPLFTIVAGQTTLLEITGSSSQVGVQVKDMKNNLVLMANADYSKHPVKSIQAVVESLPLDLNIHIDASLTMFEKKTGNSSLSFMMSFNSDRLQINAFAVPSSAHEAADFLASLQASSTFDALKFSIQLQYNSTVDMPNSGYIGDFKAIVNGQKLVIQIGYSNSGFELNITQPWIVCAPAISLSSKVSTDSENYKKLMLNMQWSEQPHDYLRFIGKLKNSGTALSYIALVSQPSQLLSISQIGASAFGDFSRNNNYSFGFNTVVNNNENGINVTYNGVLPQLFGNHSLLVNIKQSVIAAIPLQFLTRGALFIGRSEYISSWSIESEERQLISLEKTFAKNNNEVKMTFNWEQKWFERIPFSFANIKFQIGRGFGKAQIQIDSMPKISANYKIRERDNENQLNKTFFFEIKSGFFSPWVKFRTMTWSSSLLIPNNPDTRKQNVELSAVMNIDERAHFFNLDTTIIQGSKTLRLVGEVAAGHPYNLNVFGKPLPNSANLSFNIITRKQGKFSLTYNDNTMLKPFTVKGTYHILDGNRRFNLNLQITNAKFNELDVLIVLSPGSFTISAKCPERNINHELSIQSQNTEDLIEVDSVFKDYRNRPALKRYDFGFSFGKESKVIEIYFDTPKINRTVLRGDLPRIMRQAKRLLQTALIESRSTNLVFINGINRIESGYDMYIGYEVQRDATYTLHLQLSGSANEGQFAALQIKKDFELQTEVARATVKLIEGQLVQIKLTGNPVLINFIRQATLDINIEAKRKINILADNIVKELDSIKSFVVENQQIQTTFNATIDQLIEMVNDIRSAAVNFVSTYASSSNSKFSFVVLTTENGIRDALLYLLSIVESARDVTLRPFNEVYDQYVGIIMRKANNALVRKLQPVVVILQKINAGQLLIELIEEGIQNTFDYIQHNGEISFSLLREPLTELLHVDESTAILNIPLGIDISQMKPLPRVKNIKTWLARTALATTINDGIEKLYSYADDYYKARALVYIPRDELLPPFKGHAFVSDFRHFSTFDKRHYNFESGCATSHVLAADMRENNFTVAISYGDSSDRRNSRNSIEIIVKNQHVIIYDDYQVKVNNRIKELPFVLDKFSVLLEGNTVRVQRTEGDLDVACDFTKKLCSVDVSPYYFGATAGMAGVYNNEPMDDFIAPSRESMDTPAALATAWESSGTLCSSSNVYQTCETTSPNCVRLFNNTNSPLRACFPLVDPEPFMAMCKDDTCYDGESYCASVHAYAYRCSLIGALVKLPNECVKCPMVQQRRELLSPMSQNTEITSLDMVFVVQQGSCLGGRQGIAHSMKKFLKKLKVSLKQEEVEHVQYRLVGYGGPGASASPNTITIRSKSFTSSEKQLRKALAKVPISSTPKHTDTLNAISYASRLPFRAGAKAMIVVLPCDLCQSSEVSYSDVEWQLRNRGILLHHLPQKQIRGGRNWKSIYGFDSENAFSRGNTPVVRAVIKPNKDDICEPLATATGGSVWDQKKMHNNNRFLDKLSEYLVRKVNRGQRVTCKCEMNEIGVATSVCTDANRQ